MLDPLLQTDSQQPSENKTASHTGVSGCLGRHFVRIAHDLLCACAGVPYRAVHIMPFALLFAHYASTLAILNDNSL